MSQEQDYKKVKFDLKEIERDVKRNREERLKFVEFLANWIKKTPNQEWSKQQKEFLDRK